MDDAIGDQEAALRIYKKLLDVKPDSVQDLQQLLALLRKYRRKEEERAMLSSLAAAQPQNYTIQLVDFYIYYGRFEEAEEIINAAMASGTGHAALTRRLIEVYEKTNRYKAAIQVAKDFLGQLEDNEYDLEREFITILGWLYYLDNNMDMARFVVRWILELDADSHRARFLLARISLDEGRPLLAISELRGLAAEDAENADYDYYTGLAHLERAEDANAEQSFKDALKKDPTHRQALLKLAEIYLAKGFYSDVERMVKEFLAVSPDDPEVLALQEEVEKQLALSPKEG